ncbi:unnamed protein product [Leuciscus chuanchicus]
METTIPRSHMETRQPLKMCVGGSACTKSKAKFWSPEILKGKPGTNQVSRQSLNSTPDTIRPGKLIEKLDSGFLTDRPHKDNTAIIKYGIQNTTILALIKGGDKSGYRELVNNILDYGENNDLILNIDTQRCRKKAQNILKEIPSSSLSAQA